MKTSQQSDADVPVKERDDGSALASIDDHIDPFEDENEDQGEVEGHAEGGQVDQDQEDGDESEED